MEVHYHSLEFLGFEPLNRLEGVRAYDLHHVLGETLCYKSFSKSPELPYDKVKVHVSLFLA